MNYRQIKAIEAQNKKRWLANNPTLTDESGIYVLLRKEGNINYAYIGQAKHILTRLAQHLVGYQHIDLSLKKHGIQSDLNEGGWSAKMMEYPVDMLDEAERQWIDTYAQCCQLYNHTTGGQDEGKRSLGEGKTPRGYYDGKAAGYKKAKQEVAAFFKYLDYAPLKDNKLCNRKKEEFTAWLEN